LPAEDGLCCCVDDGVFAESDTTRRGPVKNAEDMKDPISTGRKRAAIAKPILEGMVCEWAYLKFAGGGVEPIIGCNNNKASHIHHGPDKDVLNNDDSNLHRICAFCHNRWHSKNDQFYGERPIPGSPFVPLPPFNNLEHDPNTKATVEEVFRSEMKWAGVILEKVDDYVA
jgi:hypothetical protein